MTKRKETILKTLMTICMVAIGVFLMARVVPNVVLAREIKKVADDASEIEIDEKISFEHHDEDKYYLLMDNDKAIYDAIVDESLKILNGEEYTKTLTFNFPYESADVKNAYRAIQHDCVYLTWWGVNCGWEVKKQNNSFELILSSPYDDEDGMIREDVLENAIGSMKNAMKFAKKVENEDIETQLNLFSNYISQCTNYSFDTLKCFSSPYEWVLNSKNFVSVFDNDEESKTICSGYSSAFQLLCSLNDIQCYQVYGYVDTEAQQHSWNKVIIDGQEYFFDITYADDGNIADSTFTMVPVEGSEYKIGGYEYHVVNNVAVG